MRTCFVYCVMSSDWARCGLAILVQARILFVMPLNSQSWVIFSYYETYNIVFSQDCRWLIWKWFSLISTYRSLFAEVWKRSVCVEWRSEGIAWGHRYQAATSPRTDAKYFMANQQYFREFDDPDSLWVYSCLKTNMAELISGKEMTAIKYKIFRFRSQKLQCICRGRDALFYK